MLLRVVTLTVLCASIVLATLAIRFAVRAHVDLDAPARSLPEPGEVVFEPFGASEHPLEITGTVFDASGAPCPRARVHARRVPRGGLLAAFDADLAAEERDAGVTFTDRDGEFTLPTRTSLACEIAIEGSTGESARVPACSPGERFAVRLDAPRAEPAREIPRATIQSEETQITIDGRCVDERGAPIAGVRLVIADQAHLESLATPRSPTTIVRSAFDGSFRVSAPASLPFPLLLAWKFDCGVLAVDLLAEQERNELRLVLAPGSSLSGRAIDESCRVLAGVEIELRGRFSGEFLPPPIAATGGELVLCATRTDSLGRFRFEDVPAGRWHAQSREGAFTVRTRPIVLAKSTTCADLMLDFGLRTASLEGHVLNSRGEPAARAFVIARGPQRARADTTADARGRFVLEGLRDEPVWLCAEVGMPLVERGVVRGSPGGAAIEIRTTPMVLVRGRVVAAKSVDRSVTILSDIHPQASGLVSTDAKGRFQFRLEEGAAFDVEVRERTDSGTHAAEPFRVNGFVAGRGGDLEIRVP